MRNTKKFSVFTLASNNMPVAIALDNIAFAMQIEDKKEDNEKILYTRVYLKELVIEEASRWIDVKETPDQFEQL